MAEDGFSVTEIENHWKSLIALGPRFIGTPAETEARNYILHSLSGLEGVIEEQKFSYQGWALFEPPKLEIVSPFPFNLSCEAFINCGSTPAEGVIGKVEYIGLHGVLNEFIWQKFGVRDSSDKLVAYISARPDGPAQPQPLDLTNAVLPHFIIGKEELKFFTLFLEKNLKVTVKGKLVCNITPQASSKNVIFSMSPHSQAKRICVSAHCDSVYTSPGANDNASAVAALLVIARRSALEKSEFPLDLCFFSGEERNLLGSRAYVAELEARNALSKVKLALNLDSISGNSAIELWVGPEAFEEQVLKAANSFLGGRGRKTTSRFPPPAGGDHQPFYEKRIPVCWIFGGPIANYHLAGDDYRAEDVENILAATELAWEMIQVFNNEAITWQSWGSLSGGLQ